MTWVWALPQLLRPLWERRVGGETVGRSPEFLLSPKEKGEESPNEASLTEPRRVASAGVPRALGQAASRALWAQTLGRLVTGTVTSYLERLPSRGLGRWGRICGRRGRGGVERNVGEENRGD